MVADDSDEVSLAIPDGDGFLCAYPLSPDGDGNYEGYVRMGQSRPTVRCLLGPNASNSSNTIELPIDGDKIVSGTQRMVLVVGGDIGITEALKVRRFEPDVAVRWTAANWDDLPESPVGLDGVDLVILLTDDDTWLEQSMAGPSQWSALKEWVQMGGRLIASVGKNGESLLADGKPLAEWVPGKYREVTLQRNTSELETFTGSNESLSVAWEDLPRSEQGVPMVRLDEFRGLSVVSEGGGQRTAPWAIRAAYGFGSVTLVTCDLGSGPLAEWESRPRFLAGLLDAGLRHKSIGEVNRGGQLSHLGFSDLSGQLRAAMEQFPGVRLIPFSWIAALALVFVALAGPIDYFLLRRFAPRMEWTWLTFPLAVIAIAALAVGLAKSWKGAQPLQNVVDLLDVDGQSGTLRCTSWAHAYHPRGGTFDVSVAPVSKLGTATGSTIGWQGLPGSAFGGMQNPATQLSMNTMDPYWDDGARLREIAIPKWSSRSLSATWWKKGDVADSTLKVDRDELLRGEFTNPLPIAIREAVICYGRSYYEVGNLAPNATYQLDALSQPRDFHYRLTRRRIVDDREIVETWNKENLKVPRIVEMMMFHDKAGGRSYTDLWNRYHSELDLTDHLVTGTAVVFGRLATPATEWNTEESDGDETDMTTKNWSFCRLLFRVDDASRPGEDTNP